MLIKDQVMDEERALYHLQDSTVENCSFQGPADGESALKEARNITCNGCHFVLRYPLWHAQSFTLGDCTMTDTCRAAIWYAVDGNIYGSTLGGIKCLRECSNVTIANTQVESEEFGWKCRNIQMADCAVKAQYIFLDSRDLTLDRFTLDGKYSFQYVENAVITNSVLNTKDAFWHTKNVTVRDSVVKGEYLGWYSEGLTLERCHIVGTQPLCYCKDLKLVDCTMEDTDLAFEYSHVTATVKGNILSVKNPASGSITADSITQIILKDSVMETSCTITDLRKV